LRRFTIFLGVSLVILILLGAFQAGPLIPALISPAYATTQTRYFTNTGTTVNTLAGLSLGTAQSASGTYVEGPDGNNYYPYFSIRVWVRSSSGTETEIALGPAGNSYYPYFGVVKVTTASATAYTATVKVPQTALAPTDSIVVRVYVCNIGYNSWTQLSGTNFITEQLGATQLNAATWTITYYGRYNPGNTAAGDFYYGASGTYNSNIAGFSYTPSVTMTVSYAISGTGGSPTAPTFNYVKSGIGQSITLTGTAAGISCDSGTPWSVTPNPLTGSGASEQWYSSQTLGGTASAQAIVFTFYHLYHQTLSYTISGGGFPTAPIFTANRNGVSTSQVLTTTPTGYWYDAGASWAITNPLSGAAGEQWVTSSTSGSLSSSVTLVFTYVHQYYLTMLTNPAGGTPSPLSEWQTAGNSVQISASAPSGYTFLAWTGSGTGNYTGLSVSPSITMNGPITETANFVSSSVQITVTSHPAIGSDFLTVDGVAYDTPHVFSWTAGSLHTLVASSPVSCGSGCQYIFVQWSDGGAQSHTITVPSEAITYTATYKTQYQVIIGPHSIGPLAFIFLSAPCVSIVRKTHGILDATVTIKNQAGQTVGQQTYIITIFHGQVNHYTWFVNGDYAPGTYTVKVTLTYGIPNPPVAIGNTTQELTTS